MEIGATELSALLVAKPFGGHLFPRLGLTRRNDGETAIVDYLNSEDRENEDTLTTGGLSAMCE